MKRRLLFELFFFSYPIALKCKMSWFYPAIDEKKFYFFLCFFFQAKNDSTDFLFLFEFDYYRYFFFSYSFLIDLLKNEECWVICFSLFFWCLNDVKRVCISKDLSLNNSISITIAGAGSLGWEDLNVEIKHGTSPFHRYVSEAQCHCY